MARIRSLSLMRSASFGLMADAHVARVERMVVVEGVLEAEGIAHRQLPVLGEALQRLRRLRRPAAAAGDDERLLRLQQQFAQLAQRAGVAPGLHRLHARQRPGAGHARQHVLGQHQHHRARAGRSWPWRRRARRIRGCGPASSMRSTRLAMPLVLGPKKLRVVDFLEGFAVALVAGDVADEQHHRRRILERGVHADRCVGGARPARDEADAGPAGQLAVRLGHEGGAALLAVDDEADAARR